MLNRRDQTRRRCPHYPAQVDAHLASCDLQLDDVVEVVCRVVAYTTRLRRHLSNYTNIVVGRMWLLHTIVVLAGNGVQALRRASYAGVDPWRYARRTRRARTACVCVRV